MDKLMPTTYRCPIDFLKAFLQKSDYMKDGEYLDYWTSGGNCIRLTVRRGMGSPPNQDIPYNVIDFETNPGD